MDKVINNLTKFSQKVIYVDTTQLAIQYNSLNLLFIRAGRKFLKGMLVL